MTYKTDISINIDFICLDCGEALEVTEEWDDYRKNILVKVKPCVDCIAEAEACS